MKIIIFAGGTGKRFWPASRKNSPKQFLPVFNNKSLLRLKFEYLIKGFKTDDIFVSTGKQYEREVQEILPELPLQNIILEPKMMDTGPALTLAVCYVASKFPDEVIATQWSDHLIKDPDIFVESVKEAENIVKSGIAKIVLLAVPARFPSPHRGYIMYNKDVKKVNDKILVKEFEKFVEKPDKQTAEEYVKSKTYGWNPGYMNFSSDYFFSKIQKTAPKTLEVCKRIVESNFSDKALEEFSTLEKIAIDYIFAEHIEASEAKVVLSEMGWSDVGEWISFKEALEESSESNVVVGSNYDMGSKNSLVFNSEESKLVATIGLEGMVVINTPQIVAVFSQADNIRLKEFLKKLEENGLEKYL